MSKGHLKPKCFSSKLEVVQEAMRWKFFCFHCNRSWYKPLGPRAEFRNGRLYSVDGSTKQEDIYWRQRNIDEFVSAIPWTLL